MPASRFRRYELRTTDLEGARAFYAEVLGPEFWDTDVSLIALPERAAAHGAPPHWLGQIGLGQMGLGHIGLPEQLTAVQPTVAGVEAAAHQLVARGAQQLGPLHRAHDGSELAALRDPFGAVLALRHEVPSA
jgi:uncharacterized protein